jgi:hypothetical protein
MNEPRTPVEAQTAIPHQLRRRVKRGIVASYIHEISERHNGAEHREAERTPAAVEAAEEL